MLCAFIIYCLYSFFLKCLFFIVWWGILGLTFYLFIIIIFHFIKYSIFIKYFNRFCPKPSLVFKKVIFNLLSLNAFHLTGNSLYPSKGQFWNPCLIQNPSPCFPLLLFFRFSAFRLHNYVCSALLGPFFDLHINAHDTSVSPFSDFLLLLFFFFILLFHFFFFK